MIGKIWIGVMPNEHTNVIGLSRYARLVDWIMGRPQIQEEAVVQLADLIMERPSPTAWPSSWGPATSACPGAVWADGQQNDQLGDAWCVPQDSALRREFLSLIPGK